MNIKVLGPGCKKCHETEKLVKEVIAETGSDAVVVRHGYSGDCKTGYFQYSRRRC